VSATVHDSPRPGSAATAALVWFRLTFIWHCVRELKESLDARGSALYVLYGRARVEIPRLAQRLAVVRTLARYARTGRSHRDRG
jgi:deoxyribodipyrimidine photolyase